ncbi:MAG: NADH-quinone oxidoreductase subunit L [Acidimicrobiales bacterium]
MLQAAFLIPALPLVGFAVLVMAGRRMGDPKAGWVATGAVSLSFVASLVTFAGLLSRSGAQRSFTQTFYSWVPVGGLQVKMAILVDPLSMTMALFVTGISALIHLYSIGYMRHDEQFSKFFIYLNLFVFSMLVLVLANNFLVSFLGWEGVGACSYFLVAFWFERDSAATAGKKAFIVNRIGDFGFLIAMFLMFATVGTLDYSGVFAHAGSISSTTATGICLMLFLGAAGKSAQIPLFPWLADAMEGPTPVSALIHAATMVTAGVYLMARVSPLLARTPATSTVIAIVGVATAFVAATIGCTQSDIKKVLAYSTVSQLGYMFLGIGSGAYVAAIFLMITHAFYKALLFLGAGSVIHGMADEQDIKLMGNLRKYLPITYVTFVIAWLSIAGVPPFSGFWSKGDVLMAAFGKNHWLWAAGAITAILTAYYMGREVFLVFFGEDRWRQAGVLDGHHSADGAVALDPQASADQPHSAGEPHEAPWVMWAPLAVLAVLATLGGVLNFPFASSVEFLGHFLGPVFAATSRHVYLASSTKVLLGAADAVFALIGVALAARLWLHQYQRPKLEPNFLVRAWRLDDGYNLVLGKGGTALARFSAFVVDNKVIDGAVNGLPRLVRGTGRGLRRLQTGYVRNYALGIAAGTVVLLAFIVSRAGS